MWSKRGTRRWILFLQVLASYFESAGLYKNAVLAYLKIGKVQAAIDCCVRLNHWDKAIELARHHQLTDIDEMLSRLVSTAIFTHGIDLNTR